MTSEDNGNGNFLKPTLSSTEDLSEYTDADESMSAPTEFLAEFLSAIMLKDYETALKYCKLILHYEPNNARAKEFYPLIIEKLQSLKIPDNDSDNEEESASSDSSSNSESDSSSSDDSSEALEEGEEDDDSDMEANGIKEAKNKKNGSKGSSNGENTTGSYSSLEDDEVVIDQLAKLTAKYNVDNLNFANGNKIYDTSNTYATSSSQGQTDNNVSSLNNQGNKYAYCINSDSESPTEPVTQETIAMLRARVVSN